jgi:hypothetical protein
LASEPRYVDVLAHVTADEGPDELEEGVR